LLFLWVLTGMLAEDAKLNLLLGVVFATITFLLQQNVERFLRKSFFQKSLWGIFRYSISPMLLFLFLISWYSLASFYQLQESIEEGFKLDSLEPSVWLIYVAFVVIRYFLIICQKKGDFARHKLFIKKLSILSLVVSITVTGFDILYHKYGTTEYAWEVNWGFKVPEASKITSVFDDTGEGVKYYIVEYGEQKFEVVKKLRLWNKMDGKSFAILSKRVWNFKDESMGLHYQEKKHYWDLFLKNPIRFDKNSLWFVKDKDDGYLIAILNVNLKKIYVLESIS
jgi:hypothetical protein